MGVHAQLRAFSTPFSSVVPRPVAYYVISCYGLGKILQWTILQPLPKVSYYVENSNYSSATLTSTAIKYFYFPRDR